MKLIAINNCLDCPHHKEVRVPGSADSFDACDTSIVCTKIPEARKTNYPYWQHGFRIVSACERPYQHREFCSIPKWCPLGTLTVKGS